MPALSGYEGGHNGCNAEPNSSSYFDDLTSCSRTRLADCRTRSHPAVLPSALHRNVSKDHSPAAAWPVVPTAELARP
ncbi:MAG: hypothetical protein P8I59_11315 [Pseudomonadales bacterium]|nr:hypothetical protein [Pseudomonadales bacterium]